MNKLKNSILILLFLFILLTGSHLYYLTTLSAKENYPEDTYLLSESDKSALIIVAHDDDMVGSSGTITKLCKAGWNIREMCFYQQGGLYAVKDSLKNPIRKKSLQRVAEIQGIAGTDPVDFNFRKDMQTEKAYFPMPFSKFPENYRMDSLLKIIGDYIEKYKPSIVFTLDPLVGGYGNPDHVVISKLINKYCREHKHDPGFTVKKIYHPVFSPSLAESILGKMEVYREAKKICACNGMPLPDAQVTISDFSREKKECMVAYTSEQNSLRKFWPFYHWYPHWIYFKIFDRDFFQVTDVNKL